MIQGEHSAVLSTFIKLPFVFVLSILEWPLKTGFTVYCYCTQSTLWVDVIMQNSNLQAVQWCDFITDIDTCT